MVEEHLAGAHHHVARDGEHAGLHGELLTLSDLDQQHPVRMEKSYGVVL